MDDKEFKAQLLSTEAGRILLEALEKMSDSLTIFDSTSSVLYANQLARARFPALYDSLENGLTRREANLASVRAALPGWSEDAIQDAAERIFAAQMAFEPIQLRFATGGVGIVHFKPMDNSRSVAISTDITELRQREKQLREAQRAAEAANEAKSAFLANTSHEIRTPLNAIVGLAQVLEKMDLPEDAAEYISSILDAGKTLTNLLNDVLDLSKIEAGKLEASPIDADLAHTLRRLLRLWRPKADEKGLELTLTLDGELPGVLSFDPLRVRQCVSNLISNAIKFTADGRVSVHASAARVDDDYEITISVTDTGIGIPEETRERLFKPFSQADGSISREFGGTGLGLAITKRLCELMGGDVGVESEAGKGSTFTMTFRAEGAQSNVLPGADKDAGAKTDALSSLSNLRVLIVDDLPINRQVVGLFLRPSGCETVEATNGKDATERLEAEDFDIVLLDVHMPVMDGLQAIRTIRASDKPYKDVPVIALTADAMADDRERYLSLGMSGYTPKPINEGDLVSEILRVLGGAAAKKARAAAASA